MAEESYNVTLNVYDLSQGLARQLSGRLLGKAIEGIWHTGVSVYGNEYYFGRGIQVDGAGSTPYGAPVRVIDLGVTHVPKDVFETYLEEIGLTQFTAESYSLLTNNCNNFSNEVAQFLVGVSIPEYILDLPKEVMSSPMGAALLPMMQQLEVTLRSGAVPQLGVGSDKSKWGMESGGDDDVARSARSKVHEEISREFAAIMATGTVGASEAAALATRRVMQRHGQGQLNVE
ncbi:hypothetical protein M569_04043 [Genlisea aurea]|uniref:PPPDE domain-containing protein n=1 Tax=Genlisea aurea TaxID=192259 RepID=S8CV95_9LAMI|nr:hypothetical protein M569_04043 [Genlisea aurea]